MNISKTLGLGFIFATLAACETGPSYNEMAQMKITESGAPQLTAAEINQALVGNSITGEGKSGHMWEIYYQSSTMNGRSGDNTDHGTWEATADNQYCRTWKERWGNQQRGCKNVYRTSAEELIFIPVRKGGRSDIATITMGNTYGL